MADQQDVARPLTELVNNLVVVKIVDLDKLAVVVAAVGSVEELRTDLMAERSVAAVQFHLGMALIQVELFEDLLVDSFLVVAYFVFIFLTSNILAYF